MTLPGRDIIGKNWIAQHRLVGLCMHHELQSFTKRASLTVARRQRCAMSLLERKGIMIDTILQVGQVMVGAVLVGLVVWLKTHDAQKIAPTRLKPWIKIFAEVALSYIAISAVLEPLIPGSPVLIVCLPHATTASRFLDNLQVRATPVGLHGAAGGDRVIYAGFDTDGKAVLVPELTLFETRVTIEVFDLSQPSQIVKSATVYINPFAKRQIINKTITLEKE
jgi:hypothetical protein